MFPDHPLYFLSDVKFGFGVCSEVVEDAGADCLSFSRAANRRFERKGLHPILDE